MKHLSIPVTYEIDRSFDSSRFIKLRLRICHDGTNPNGSHFSLNGFEAARDSLENTPLLAHVVINDGGIPDFGAHDVDYVEDKDTGEITVRYLEQPIGVIPHDNNYAVEEYNGRNYVCADAYAWRGYINEAEQIIEREKDINLSMEIDVDDGHYDKATRTYFVDVYRYLGITLLSNSIGTGMIDAQATINFSNDNLISFMRELKQELEVDFSMRGGTQKLNKEMIAQILSEYKLTEDSLNFAITDTMDETALRAEVEKFVLQSTIINELYEKLSNAETIECEWGCYSRYFYVDYDPEVNEVYFWDASNDWKLYGAPFTMEGDTATIDFAGCKRKKYVIADFIEGTENKPMAFGAVLRSATDAMNKSFATLQATYDAYCAEHTTPNADVETLRQFRADRLDADHKAEIDAVVAEFAELDGNAEFAALDIYGFSDVDALREKCFAILGKSKKQFAAKVPKPVPTKMPIDTPTTPTSDPYPGADAYLSK